MTSRPGQACWHAGDTGDTLPGQAAPSEKLPTAPLAPDTAECWDESSSAPVPSGTAGPGLRSRGPVPCSRSVPRALHPRPPGLEAAPSPCAPLQAGTACRKLAAVFLSTWTSPCCDGRARGLEETFPCSRGSWLAQLLQGLCLQPGALPASPSTAQPALSLQSTQASLPRSVGASNCSPASHSRNWFKLSCFKAPQGAPCHRSTKHSSCGVFLQRGAQPQGTNLVATCRGPGAAAMSAQSRAQPPLGPNLPAPCHGVGHGAARRLLVVLPEQAATQTTLARPRGG